MRNKILIGAGILLTVFIVFLIIICGASSGGNNTLPEEELKEVVMNVTCDVQDEESLTYDMSILVDETQFNDEIQNKNYTKIKFNQSQNFNSLGVDFIVKTTDNATITFSLMKNEEVLNSTTLTFENSVFTDVNLTPGSAVEVSAEDEFYVVISQSNETQFVFDNMLFFLSEE